ncbi:MAG: hypothetical protein WA958_11000 [Tunicatimonas sp.]
MKPLEKRTELVSVIQRMSEEELNRLYQLMTEGFPYTISKAEQPLAERPIGSMKGMLVYMADDFNAPLDDFTEYMPNDEAVS